MRINLPLLLLAIGLPHSICQAQTKPASFTVIYAEGPAMYRASTTAVWRPLDVRNRAVVLSPQTELKLSQQTVLALAQPDRKPVVLRDQNGPVKLTSVQTNPTDDVANVLSDYFGYLWRNLTHHHESIDTYAQGYMKRKGVVSRGDGCTAPLMLTPDYGAAIAGDSAIRFAWKAEPNATSYTFAVYDNYDDRANQLYRTDVADTTLLFSLDKPFLERDVTYHWTVYPTGTPNCARYTFSLPKSDVYRQLEAKIATLRRDLPTDAALMAFMTASLFERSGFYPDAYRAYFQAHRLAAANPLYRQGLALFLARRGLTQQAKAVLAVR